MLGTNNSNVVVNVVGNSLTVRVVYSNYNSTPVIPILNIPAMAPCCPCRWICKAMQQLT
ncbi:hypothetical protein [Methylobacillus glycogenes]|uniref:hypothetical protein n=1 Tax=Methylobacillus glycogenes TaxID=406 RepID=UPI001F1891F4|nr:hypothetical protein [Methylobacillus glycogenes]